MIRPIICPSECARTPEPFTPSTTHPLICTLFLPVSCTRMPRLFLFLITRVCVHVRGWEDEPEGQTGGFTRLPRGSSASVPFAPGRLMWDSSPDVGEIISCCILAGWGGGWGEPFRKTKAHSLWQKNPNTHTSSNKSSPLSRMRQHCDNKHICMILLLFFIFFLNRSLSYTYSPTCSWQIFMAHPYFSYILQSLVCLWGYGKWTSEPVGRWWADLCGLNTRLLQRNTCTVNYIPLKGVGGGYVHTPVNPLWVCVFFFLNLGICYNVVLAAPKTWNIP